MGEKCTQQEVDDLNCYLADFVADLKRTKKFSNNGEGGFIESCLEHVAAQGSYGFDDYVVDKVHMRDALSSWWNAAAPHQCNPSCVSTLGEEADEYDDDFADAD